MIQDFVTSFPIVLDEYPILCILLVSNPVDFMPMLWDHLAGKELKKRVPDHVSNIEQERVKYMTQLTEWLIIWAVIVCDWRSEKWLDTDNYRSISTPDLEGYILQKL
jgi:hypothetical protein